MKVFLPYGKDGKIEVHVDESRVAGIIEPNAVDIGDEMDIIKKGTEKAIKSKNFEDFIADAKDILFIVNDHTRPTPTAKILDSIYDKIKNQNIKFLVATGVHRSPNEDEFNFIFGKHYENLKDKIYIHDSKKDEEMSFLGTSSTGTEMYVNKLGVDAHKMVTVGSVEPHYFAGYTGGRKSFLPGVASYKTIGQNHKHALLPQAKALVLDGNPVHEDMIDALKTIEGKEIYSIQTVLDGERRIYGCTSGHIHESFYQAIDKAHEVFCVDIEEKADIVVSVAGYPSDVDLYQAQKALDNGKLALKEGGILILVGECRSGIGSEAFFKLLCSSDTPQKALDTIKKEYKLGYHKAAKMAEIGVWAEMWGVTELSPQDMEGAFIKPFNTVQEALDAAFKQKGSDAKALFLLDGSLTVPKVEGE